MAGLLLGMGLVGSLPMAALSGAALAAPAGVGISPSAIVVEGNRRVEADTVRSYFKPGPNGTLDANSIDAALKALYATGLFQDVHISQSGGKLIVTVVEGQIINRVAYEGNHRMKDEQLSEEIQSKERSTLSKSTVQADVQRIIEIYQRNGRFDVSVVPKLIERPNNRVDLVFEINEGEKTGIKHIVFVGNKAYSDWRLKDVIKTAESNFLSFLQTTDVYDADRIEADRDLIRRFYLKHGYADVQVVSATGVYDPGQKGFTVTFTIEEGPLYHFGAVDIQSNVRAVDAASLRTYLLMSSGQVYNGEAIEKTVEAITIELARRGYPFGTVRPRGDRNPQSKTIGVVFVVDEGQRAYIERINIRGNYRTRDYVIRREFDIGEGDPYNRALVDRAERRIKNLNFFKSVKITNEPGSAPDRVVINVDVEENSTGDFSVMGGYSTSDGWLGEVSVQERNLLGTGRFARAAVTYGQYTKGIELDYAEPYFLDYRASLGVDLFAKQTLSNTYISYGTESYGGVLKWGLPLREDLAIQLRYSAYVQDIQLPSTLDNCNNINPDFANTFPTLAALRRRRRRGVGLSRHHGLCRRYRLRAGTADELSRGWRSVAAGPRRACRGADIHLGARLRHRLQFARQQQEPDQRRLFQFRSGLCRRWRRYRLHEDDRGLPHLLRGRRPTSSPSCICKAAQCDGFNDCPSNSVCAGGNSGYVRMLDDFKMGPNLVRGFQPAGIGPRDITFGTTNDNIGGTNFWGASLEFQYPFYFLPKDSGFRGAVFADAGSVWGYRGETQYPPTGEINGTITINGTGPGGPFACQCGMAYNDSSLIRSSVGASLIWDSPFGPLRFDFAYPITKGAYDRTQWFAFGGGAKF